MQSKLSIPEIKIAISDAFNVGARGLVPFVWGPVGIGKSEGVEQVASERGAAFVDIRLSMFDPVDLRGLPSILSGATIWNRPAIWPVDTTRETILFFDEFDRAPLSVVNAALQIVLNRRIGEHVLPDSVRIVAAGNGSTDKGTNKLPGASANRFAHLYAQYDAAATRDHFKARGHDMIAAFLHLRPALGHIDAMREEAARNATTKAAVDALQAAGHAFPSPRQWEAEASCLGLPLARRKPLISGLVGDAPASELEAFLSLYGRVPSIPAILADPNGAPVVDDIGLHYAVTTALARAATRANFAAVAAYWARLPVEFATMGMIDAVTRDATLKETATFSGWAIRNPDVAL